MIDNCRQQVLGNRDIDIIPDVAQSRITNANKMRMANTGLSELSKPKEEGVIMRRNETIMGRNENIGKQLIDY